MKDFLLRWWPVIFRCSIYVAIALLTSFLNKTDGLDADRRAAMDWLDWTRLYAGVSIEGLIVIRSFFDETLSRTRSVITTQKGQNEKVSV